MRASVTILLLGLFCFAHSQRVDNIWRSYVSYYEIADRAVTHQRSEAEFIDSVTASGFLPIYQFNNSYLRSIRDFFEFLQLLEYGEDRKCDKIKWTPLHYLQSVIAGYEKEGNYRVAILFYNTADGEPPLQDTRDRFYFYTCEDAVRVFTGQIREPDTTQVIDVWYLSKKTLQKQRSNSRYAQFKDLEYQVRQDLAVTSLATERSVRSKRKEEGAGASPGLPNAAQQLRQLLLPDSILTLLRQDSINGVIVIPYGTIGQVPFAMLPIDSVHAFVDQYAYAVSPHPVNFFNQVYENPALSGKANKLTTKRPVIVGNPKFKSSKWLELPPLPGAEREAKLVADMLQTNALIGEEANLSRVVDSLLVCDFAYLATHALPSYLDPVNKSFLALAPAGSSDNGFLYVADLHKFDLESMKLSILSACQTGMGKDYKSGYCNTGRAFFVGGVDNNIISLWNLDDENIVAYMKILMEELQKPQYFYPAENLRHASLRHKTEVNSNPAYWSAMVNFGVCY